MEGGNGYTYNDDKIIMYISVSPYIVLSETAEQFSIKVILNFRCCVVNLILYLIGKSVVIMNLINFMGNGTSNNFYIYLKFVIKFIYGASFFVFR
jgi:hypothetical protein